MKGLRREEFFMAGHAFIDQCSLRQKRKSCRGIYLRYLQPPLNNKKMIELMQGLIEPAMVPVWILLMLSILLHAHVI